VPSETKTKTATTAGKNLFFYNLLKVFFLDFNLQMPDTKLWPTTKDSAMGTPQIAIHIWISFVLN